MRGSVYFNSCRTKAALQCVCFHNEEPFTDSHAPPWVGLHETFWHPAVRGNILTPTEDPVFFTAQSRSVCLCFLFVPLRHTRSSCCVSTRPSDRFCDISLPQQPPHCPIVTPPALLVLLSCHSDVRSGRRLAAGEPVSGLPAATGRGCADPDEGGHATPGK